MLLGIYDKQQNKAPTPSRASAALHILMSAAVLTSFAVSNGFPENVSTIEIYRYPIKILAKPNKEQIAKTALLAPNLVKYIIARTSTVATATKKLLNKKLEAISLFHSIIVSLCHSSKAASLYSNTLILPFSSKKRTHSHQLSCSTQHTLPSN